VSNHSCIECTLNHGIYCVETPRNLTIDISTINKNEFNSICCRSNFCKQQNNQSWTCTNKSQSEQERFKLCPVSESCGTQRDIAAEIGKNITLPQMEVGDACFYEIYAPCGLPIIVD
jgi:hypothetical protein